MEAEERVAARGQMIALMQAGHPWREAAAMAGVQIGRSAAYQLLRNVRLRGEVALQDGRHGHPAKLREPVREVLETTCREAPHTPSREVQAVLQERFGILVSIGHLNRMRAKLGVGSRPVHWEKTSLPLHARGTELSRRGRWAPPRSRSPRNRPASHPGDGFGFESS
jgi:transposase